MKNHWRDRVLAFGTPSLLIAVACLQIYRATTLGQSPWKGGGFGMYTCTDKPGARFLRCYLLTGQGELPVQVPRSLDRLVRMACVVPTRDNLLPIAKALVQQTWPADARYRRQNAPLPVEFSAARVEVWRYRFVSSTRELRIEKLADVTERNGQR